MLPRLRSFFAATTHGEYLSTVLCIVLVYTPRWLHTVWAWYLIDAAVLIGVGMMLASNYVRKQDAEAEAWEEIEGKLTRLRQLRNARRASSASCSGCAPPPPSSEQTLLSNQAPHQKAQSARPPDRESDAMPFDSALDHPH